MSLQHDWHYALPEARGSPNFLLQCFDHSINLALLRLFSLGGLGAILLDQEGFRVFRQSLDLPNREKKSKALANAEGDATSYYARLVVGEDREYVANDILAVVPLH